MKYSGYYMEFEEAERQAITDAIVTDNRISIDWAEEGFAGHLEANSTDGVNFRGTFSYDTPGPEGTFELKLFTAKNGDRILSGMNIYEAERTMWIIYLYPR